MNELKSAASNIAYHGKILLKGFIRIVYGTATAGLVAIAVYGLAMVTSEEGWVAVCDFIASTASLVVALSCTYAMGGHTKKGAKR